MISLFFTIVLMSGMTIFHRNNKSFLKIGSRKSIKMNNYFGRLYIALYLYITLLMKSMPVGKKKELENKSKKH